MSKHFPKQQKYYKIFNKNTVKLSSSCMPNMSSIITKHNKKFFNKKSTKQRKENVTAGIKRTVRWRVNVSQNVLCTKQVSVAETKPDIILERPQMNSRHVTTIIKRRLKTARTEKILSSPSISRC